MDDSIKRVIELQVRASQDSVRRLDEIARSARNVESMAERAGRAWGTFSSLLASGILAGAVASLTRVATAMDDIGDAAQRAGTSAGFMGWLDRIGKANETDLPELERAMRALNLSIDEAQNKGSGAAKAFKQLGLDASALGAEDLPAIARALNGIEDRAERARIETELFGKAGYSLSLTLAAIAEKGEGAESEIAAFTDKMRDAYDRAGEFDKNMKLLQQTVTDLAQGFTAGLLPAINSFADGVGRGGDAYSNAEGFGAMLGRMATNAMKWGSAIGLVYDYLRKPLLPGFAGDFKKDLQFLKDGWDAEEFRKKYLPGGMSLGDPRLPQARAAEGTASSAGRGRAAATIKGQSWAAFSADWSPRALRWDMESRELAGDATGPAEEIHRIQEALDRLTGQDKVKELSANLGLLHDAMDRGVISAEQYDEAVQRLFADTIPDNVSKTNDALKAVSTGITDFAGDIAEALVDADTNIGQKFESIVRNFAKFLIRMQAEAAARPFANWLANLFGGGIGAMSGSGGAVQGGDYFGSWGTGSASWSAKGNAFGPGGLMAFASGGVVTRPTLFGHGGGLGLMGESGPEAVMPLRRGPGGKLGVEGAAPQVSVAVPVYVENKSGAQVSVREERGRDGMRQIRMLITDAVRGGISSGEFDRELSTGYGLTRQGRR